MGRIFAGYIALCEIVAALGLGLEACFCCVLVAFDAGHRLPSFAAALGFGILCAVSIRAAVGLYRGDRWGWYASWSLGLLTVAFSCFILWGVLQPHQYGDSGWAGLLGIAVLVFAIPALFMLGLPATRRYLYSQSADLSANLPQV